MTAKTKKIDGFVPKPQKIDPGAGAIVAVNPLRCEFLNEREAIASMLKDAAVFGYGNFIARLREAWIDRLVEKEGLSEAAATAAAFTSPRPRKDRDK